MEKVKYWSVIRFMVLNGEWWLEIKEKLDNVYGKPAPSMTIIGYWVKEFQRGRTSVFYLQPDIGINLMNFLEKGETITEACYKSLLDILNAVIKEKRLQLDLPDLKYNSVSHPLYSPIWVSAITICSQT